MLADLRIDELDEMRLEAFVRAFLIGTHQARIAHHIGGEDRGETAGSGGRAHCSGGPPFWGLRVSSSLPRFTMLGAACGSDQKNLYFGRSGQKGTVMGTWQVQEAKTRLSEVIERARTEGPQTITRHGAERAVVISIEDYRALVAYKPDFKAHLLGGPKVDDFTIERDRDTGRPVEL